MVEAATPTNWGYSTVDRTLPASDMKEIVLVFCTPDMHRPMARRAIRALKATDLTPAELMILDNAYDERFHHPAVMDEMLQYAGGRPVIFLDDDVVVQQHDWIARLRNAVREHDAAVVGCVHTFATGERQHSGILVHRDASTEMLRDVADDNASATARPALSSALMLVRNTDGLRFDRRFEKYQHDVDICLAAWSAGRTVMCTTDLVVIHEQAEYMRRRPEFHEVLQRDMARLCEKWAGFAASGLYARPELRRFAAPASEANWERVYNDASRLETHSPADSASRFRDLATRCPHSWHRAGAYFHLYKLEHRVDDLQACVRENPYHVKAADLLRELPGPEELR
jgi:hypothetical protein